MGMRTLGALVMGLASILFIDGFAIAGDLYTPPLAFGSSDSVSCDITNVSAQTRSFTLELIDTSGTVRASGGNTLAPGASGGGGIGGSVLVGELFYCHFAVTGTPTQFRAAIKRRDSTGGDIVVAPAQ